MHSPFIHPANVYELGTYILVSKALSTKKMKKTNATRKPVTSIPGGLQRRFKGLGVILFYWGSWRKFQFRSGVGIELRELVMTYGRGIQVVYNSFTYFESLSTLANKSFPQFLNFQWDVFLLLIFRCSF